MDVPYYIGDDLRFEDETECARGRYWVRARTNTVWILQDSIERVHGPGPGVGVDDGGPPSLLPSSPKQILIPVTRAAATMRHLQ